MSQECEYIQGCPMFRYFCKIAQKVYVEVYCQGYFDVCARRQLRTSGKPVPDNLLPHGGTLWNDEDSPPKYWPAIHEELKHPKP